MKRERLHFPSLPSTSDYLKEHRSELGDFSFVSADYQSQGRGRTGRTWVSPPGENLMFSFLIKNPAVLCLGPKITLAVAVGVAKALEEAGIEDIFIKWPNDIYLNDRKIVGILLEGDITEYVIVGVGVNVNQTEFNGDYRIPPTSVALTLGHPIDLATFKHTVYESLETVFQGLPMAFGSCLDYYATHDYLRAKMVTVEGKGPYLVLGVDDGFALRLRGEEGEFSSNHGEVSVIQE